MRDARRACVNAQLQGGDATEARANLNAVYDAFVAKFGFLNDPANKRLYKDDPDAPPVMTLEKYDLKTKTATKDDIFTRDTVRKPPPVTKVNNAAEALGACLHESGKMDMERMAEMMGVSKIELGHDLIAQGLAYQDPAEGWQPADQYLSGNVRRKLVLAQTAAATDATFKPNVEALLKITVGINGAVA